MVLFLNLEKKAWIIKDLKIPVIEDVPMKDLLWFRNQSKEAEKLKNKEDATITEGLEFDEIWWEKTCQIGLGKSMEEIIDTGISEKDFRSLMQEVYNFLIIFSTIEEVKQSGMYDQEIQKKESKQ
jgi:hypothetical protein